MRVAGKRELVIIEARKPQNILRIILRILVTITVIMITVCIALEAVVQLQNRAPEVSSTTVEETTVVIEEPVPTIGYKTISIVGTRVPSVDEELQFFINNIPLEADLVEYVYNEAMLIDLPPEIAFALAKKESTFNPSASSGTNDHGLFQTNQSNFDWVGNALGVNLHQEIYDPYVSTDCMTFMIDDLINRYESQNWHHVLMQYNEGPGAAAVAFRGGRYSSEYSRYIINQAMEYGLTEEEIQLP